MSTIAVKRPGSAAGRGHRGNRHVIFLERPGHGVVSARPCRAFRNATEGETMSKREARSTRSARLLAATLVLAGGTTAAAQLSTPTFVNNSNPDQLSAGSAAVPSFERETTVGLASSAGGGFVTRFTALVTADGDGGPGV